jgi:hypothetical protein
MSFARRIAVSAALTCLVCFVLPGCGGGTVKKFKITLTKGGQTYQVPDTHMAALMLIPTANPNNITYSANWLGAKDHTAVFEVADASGKQGIPKGEYKIGFKVGLYGVDPRGGGAGGPPGGVGGPPGGVGGPPGGVGGPGGGPGGAEGARAAFFGMGKDVFGDKFAPEKTKIIRKIDGSDITINVDNDEG